MSLGKGRRERKDKELDTIKWCNHFVAIIIIIIVSSNNNSNNVIDSYIFNEIDMTTNGQ